MSTAPIVPIDANDPDTMPRLLRQWETATPTVQGLFGHSFKKYIQEGLNVGTNQRIALDISLQLGNQVESVTVSADVTL